MFLLKNLGTISYFTVYHFNIILAYMPVSRAFCGFCCMYSAYSCKGDKLWEVSPGINETKFKSTFSFGNSLGD